MPRFYCPVTLAAGQSLELPESAARHVQVLRLQPGAAVTLFDGAGGEYAAVVDRMGRGQVRVQVGAHSAVEREAHRQLHLAVGMPANERMDWLVEKATELGAASIQPLVAQRGVLKLKGERAARKQAHWQAIAVAACEQCGRNRVPLIHDVKDLSAWLAEPMPDGARVLLSLDARSWPVSRIAAGREPVLLLSGPEGGFTPQEERTAFGQGFAAASLGAQVLRAETAPLAALAVLALSA
jgi:16S rRNA (uracil1498-N3)-methyltransferase